MFNLNYKKVFIRIIVSLAFLSSYSGQAQGRFDDVKIETKSVRGTVYALYGAGGNIGVSAGKDGILMIDDQFGDLAEKISGAISTLGSDQPKYIINTHHHGDHTGSNAYFKKEKHATIFAHENVRLLLSRSLDPKIESLPVVTYQSGVKFYFNDEVIDVQHLPTAHTSGDSVIWFEKANVLHTGDLFFNERFPFIDLDSGGDVMGYIAAAEKLMARLNNDSIIIPGHGNLAEKSDYQSFVSMIKATNDVVDNMKVSGMSEDEVVAKGLPEEWKSWAWNFISEERWIRTLYRS